MPDITVNVRVVGAAQAAEQLSQVGTAANTAGSRSATASGGVGKLGSTISGAAIGAFSLVNGLTGIQDTMDGVERSDNSAAIASRRYELALKQRDAVQAKMTKATQETTKIEQTNNGEMKISTQRILDYNAATGMATIQTTTANGEIQKETKSMAGQLPTARDLALADENVATRKKSMELAIKEATKAHEREGIAIGANVLQMGFGAAAMVPFVKSLFGVGQSSETAATGIGAAATETGKAGSAFSGVGGTLLKIAAPLGAAAIAYYVLKNNVGGARDALNSFGEKLGNAVPAIKPVLNIIKDIGQAIGIEAGPGLQNLQKDFSNIATAVSPFVNALKNGLAQASGSFQTFLSQIGKGDISGAFHTLIQSASTLGSQIVGAIKSVNWSAVWQGLQDAFFSSVNWIKTTASALGSAVSGIVKGWNWGDAWKSLQDAFWSSVKFLNNVQLSVTAGIKWIIGNVINPGLAELQKHLPTWPQVTQSVGVIIDWFVKNAINPAISLLTPWLPTWKDITSRAGLIIDFFISVVNNPLQAVLEARAPKYAPITVPVSTVVKATLEKVVLPSIDIVLSSLVNGITTAIRNAPSAATAIGKAISSWVFAQIPGTITVDASGKKVVSTGLTYEGVLADLSSFGAWVAAHLPSSVTALKTLTLTVQNIDWSGMQGALDDAAQSIGVFFTNAIIAKINSIPILGQALNIKPLQYPVEIKADKLKQDLKSIDEELSHTTDQKRIIQLQADKTNAYNALRGLQDQLHQIPGHVNTAFEANTAGGIQKISGYQQAIVAIPSGKSSYLNVDDVTALPKIAGFSNAVSGVPDNKNTTLNADDKPGNISLNTWLQNLANGVPKEILTKLAADASSGKQTAEGYNHELHTLVPGTVPSKLLLDSNDATQKLGDFNHHLGVAAPPTATTKLQADTSQPQSALPGYHQSLTTNAPTDWKTSFVADTQTAQQGIIGYGGDIQQKVPTSKTTNILLNTATAVADLSNFIRSSLLSIPPYVPVVIVTNAQEQIPLITNFVNTGLGMIPRSVVIAISADISGVTSSTHAVNNLINTIPKTATTTFKFDDSQALGEISRLKSALSGLMTMGGGGVITLHAALGGTFIMKANSAISSAIAAMRAAAAAQSRGGSSGSPPLSGYQSGGSGSPPISGYQSGGGASPPISGSGGGGSSYPYQGYPITADGSDLSTRGPYIIAGHNATYNQTTGVFEERNTGRALAHAAQGGSFIVSSPTMFGNLMVGEGHKPELLTYIPFQNGSGGILDVQPLTGPNRPRGSGGFNHMKDGGFANLQNIGNSIGSSSSSSSSISHLLATIEKLVSTIQKNEARSTIRDKAINANLYVDGQRMARNVQKYLGQSSYGDR